MTVSTLSQKISYDGDGTATALAVPFQFWDETELEVVEINLTTYVETVLTLTSDYTVSGGDGATGTVTPVAVRPTTVRWLIHRDTALTQGTDLAAGTRFPAESVEDSLDRLTHIAQEQDDRLDRSITISAADTPWTGVLPAAADRASMYLGFDANGEPVALSAPTGTSVTTAFTLTLLDDATEAAWRATLDAMENVFTTRGDLVRGGVAGVPERVGAGTLGQYVRYDGNADPNPSAPQLPDFNLHFKFPGLLHGFGLLNNVANPTTHIDIAVGSCRDSTSAVFVSLVSAITKRLDTVWAVGTGNGGRATAATLANDTWYHVFAIMVANAYGVVDVGFDTSLTAVNLLAESGYTYYRRIGSVKTAAAATTVEPFVQDVDEFLWGTPPAIIDTTVGTAALQTLPVPPGIKVRAIVNAYFLDANENVQVYLSSPDAADQAPSSSATPLGALGILDGGTNSIGSVSGLQVRTNTAKQIRARSSGTGTVLRIATLGWVDSRGKL